MRHEGDSRVFFSCLMPHASCQTIETSDLCELQLAQDTFVDHNATPRNNASSRPLDAG